MPPMGRGSPSTKDSSGSTVALALTSPSSSMTWTCSGSRRAFWTGSKDCSQWEAPAPNAANPTRANASLSPSLYLRRSIVLRLSRVRQDSTGRAAPGSPTIFPALFSLARRFPSLYRIGHPAAPLSVLPLVADAAPERGVGGELGAVGAGEILPPLLLHPRP